MAPIASLPLLLGLLLPTSGARAQAVPEVLRLLPHDSIAVFAATGRESIRAAWVDSKWGALWAEPEIQAWVSPLVRELGTHLETMRGEVGFTPGDLFDAIEGGFAVAWTRFDPGAETAAVAFAVECGSRKDRFEAMLETALARVREDQDVRLGSGAHRGVPIQVHGSDREEPDEGGRVRTAFVGSTFLAVASNLAEDGLEEMIDRAQGLRGDTSLVQDPRFRSTLERTGGGTFVGYFDVDALLRAVGATEPSERWKAGLAAAGIETGTVVGGSYSFGGAGSRTAIYLGGARRGLLSLAQMPTGEFRTLRFVPGDAATAAAMRVDAKRVWEGVVAFVEAALPRKAREAFRSGLQRFEGEIGLSIGEDLLAALGDEIGLFSIRREADGEEEPFDFEDAFRTDLDRSVAVFALRRPGEIEGHLASLLRNVGLGPTMRTEEVDGRRIHSFVFLMMQAAYAVDGDLLVVAASSDRVAETLRRASEPGFVPIARSPRFAAALAGLPGPRAAVTFSDTRAVIDDTLRGLSAVGGMLEGLSSAARRSSSESGARWATLIVDLLENVPAAEVFRRHLDRDSAGVLVPDGEGILYVGVGP